MRLTGSEIIAEMLLDEGVPYVLGIPGHGNVSLVDALRRRQDRIKVITPRHEQSAAHMADGYARVTGEPLAIFTSIGPGATNTIIGLAAAYVDSIPMLVMIGEAHTHMRGVGVLQEVERKTWSDLPRAFAPVVKRQWEVNDAGQLQRAVSQAFNTMRTGRPGPTLITLPMDVQADMVELESVEHPQARRPHNRQPGDPRAIRQAAELLVAAKRPVILAGGGTVISQAEAELQALAEHLGACVATTMMGKGVMAEDHPLYAWQAGHHGTISGNAMAASADVLLAVGVRFSDKTASSYRPGATFNIPPTHLIHADIDPFEIGKNYPVEVGIVGDAKAVLADLLVAVRELIPPRHWHEAPYTLEIAERVSLHNEVIAGWAEDDASPVTMGRAIAEVREALPAEGILLSSSGLSQGQIMQQMSFSKPRKYISEGGFSCMGWAYPAALGAQLAAPNTPVIALMGDGDFLMTIQEIATAVQYGLPTVAVVLNNQGWQAIRDLQKSAYGDGTEYATMFERRGRPVTPHIAEAATAFGAHGVCVSQPGEVADAVSQAIKSGQPSVVEVIIDDRQSKSGGAIYGWWDVPIPAYMSERREVYDRERREERF